MIFLLFIFVSFDIRTLVIDGVYGVLMLSRIRGDGRCVLGRVYRGLSPKVG